MKRYLLVLSFLTASLCGQTLASHNIPDLDGDPKKRLETFAGSSGTASLPKKVDLNQTILFWDKVQLGLLGFGVSAHYAHKIDWSSRLRHIAKNGGIMGITNRCLHKYSSTLRGVGIWCMLVYTGYLLIDINDRQKRLPGASKPKALGRTPADWGAGI